ncbi:MAG: N-acetylmuramoyl-L-alanine amidase [Paenisporosarcina sp.]
MLKIKKIIVDAGHGPNTVGKRSPDGTLKEFAFNKAVAQLVKQLISIEDVCVIFTHDDTHDVPLNERIKLANGLKVDGYISIHANAFGTDWNEVHGIETFTCLHAQKITKDLAKSVQKALIKETGRKDRGVKQRDFAVLRETTMPAILVECGFMTNKQEMKLLRSLIYQKQCAQAIAQGVLRWLL